MRAIATAMAITLALTALATTSAQQEPPYRYYGMAATAGDEIMVYDALGHEAGSTTVASNGSWYIDVDRDRADNASFTVNGEQAQADITRTGAGQSVVTLTLATTGDQMPEDDSSLLSDDDDATLDDDATSEDEFSLQEDDDSLADAQGDSAGGVSPMIGFPNTGGAGLAGADGMSTDQTGLISALVAVAIGAAAALAGCRLRRTRRRAV